MDWDEVALRPTGNEIRFADEIQPGGLDDIPATGGDDILTSFGLNKTAAGGNPPAA